jgi:hypothetical protein
MKRKSLREWIRENRAAIDWHIKKVCPNCSLNDAERRSWILNDESLYMWARSEGVNI